jgi:hypothetical protein
VLSVPSTLISRIVLRDAAPVIMKARWTATSAPSNARLSVSGLRTSPRRYSIFGQPCSAGSKGRRAIPMTLATRSSACSRGISANPKVPVGPVTATVSTCSSVGMA